MKPIKKGMLLRLTRSDLRYGGRQVAGRLLALALVANVLCFMLYTLVASGRTEVSSLSFADYLAACVGGIETRFLNDGESFDLPAGWLCLCGLMAYIVLDYPSRDLKGIGAHVVVASGSRRCWWMSKCIWVFVMCCVSWTFVVVSCALWATLAGSGLDAPGSLRLTPGVSALLGFQAPYVIEGEASIAGFICVVPLALFALCAMQLALSVAVAPVVGFATVVATLLLSALHANAALLGNYLMLARHESVSTVGVTCGTGVLVSLVFAAAFIAIGGLAYSRRDVYGKEADDS